MISSELAESGNFIRTCEATKECFQNEWRALEGGIFVIFQQYEAARLQIHEEHQHMQAAFAAVDGENKGPKQRIWQLEGQIQHTLEHAKSVRDANGAPAAENGILKAGRIQTAMGKRCASAQRSEPNTQLPQQREVTVFHAPQTGEQQLQENNNPLMANVGFRRMQGLRDELGETSFRPEEKIRTHEGALEYLTATSPEHLCAARRGMFPMLSKPGFCCKMREMQ
ncbi:hypothetical protein ERJ75_001209000 [Trypanosoma vivax]|nr:hypothetical protein ERJ75_001209000 [Trypanosoma vivax]